MITPEPTERDLYPYNCLKGFAIVPNKLINDKRLSMKDKMLWIFYQSRPPEWRWNVSGTATALGVSRDAIIKINKNLKKYGYLVIRQANPGKFGRTKYYLDGEPDLVAEAEEEAKENGENGKSQNQQANMGGDDSDNELPALSSGGLW